MSAKRFEGKVAVVTGGNSGIGLGVAKAYAREGAAVVITGRDEKTLASAAKEIGSGTLALQSDATKIAEIDKAMAAIREKHGRIDALFINAGIGEFMPVEQVTEAFFDKTFAVNVKGVYFTIQKALPLMKEGSAIVLNASINGHIAMPNASVYAATKAAVLSLAKNLSEETVGRGIRINTVSPGPIESALLSRTLSPDQLKQTNDWIVSQVPMKRFGKPEDIAAAVLYLTAPESGFVIAADIVIDGGDVNAVNVCYTHFMVDLFPESNVPKPSLLRVDKSTYQFPVAASEIQILDNQGSLLWQKLKEKETGPIRWQGVDKEGRVLETGDYVCKLIYPDGRSVDIPFAISK